MRIGTPREIKADEHRVGLTPSGVRELVAHGHSVFVESGAGEGIGLFDEAYRAAGAKLLGSAKDLFAQAELVVKVKEPQPDECRLLRQGQLLLTYLHLAPDRKQAQALMDSGCIAIAYETVIDAAGRLPLLAPMSEVAGRLSVQAGAHAMEKPQGGNGVLLGGIAGVAAARVLIIGGGVVGYNAARMALGLGARVRILDRALPRLNELDQLFQGAVDTVFSTRESIEQSLRDADLVIGAVLVPGASAPKLVRRKQLKIMRPGTVLVDVAIDQGGCFESSRPTTHHDPIFVEQGVVHYCVANMPGAVARTSTFALTNATLPYVLKLADQGYHHALLADEGFRAGLNVYQGRLTHPAVAESLARDYVPAKDVLKPWWSSATNTSAR
ncbi:MAG: alanine dehydrogenase [Panacagrimonas sp.]